MVMIAGMARQIVTIELIFIPVSSIPRFDRNAALLGAAPWKIAAVTREMTSGRSALTSAKAIPSNNPSRNRPLYGLT